MSMALEITDLCKDYPAFHLRNVSFSLEEGSIMGLIGRNGAGKTTTLKSLLGLVRPASGRISFWGTDFADHEAQINQRIGYVIGGTSYYQRRRINEIADVTKAFYQNWDDGEYRRCLDEFSLDESKRLLELSEGMKVKFNLALALSHHAELLILDEPTSGLDPVSREELLELFMDIVERGASILFSTHIISDLEKCADSITYLHEGQVLASEDLSTFQEKYRLVARAEGLSDARKERVIGTRRNREGHTALILKEDAPAFAELSPTTPDLETIMSHLEAGEE
jgi:ABC-2 type transport system ATP-binding protein